MTDKSHLKEVPGAAGTVGARFGYAPCRQLVPVNIRGLGGAAVVADRYIVTGRPSICSKPVSSFFGCGTTWGGSGLPSGSPTPPTGAASPQFRDRLCCIATNGVKGHHEEKYWLRACALLAIVSNSGAVAQTQTLEQKIWTLLDDPKAVYVSLGERILFVNRSSKKHERPPRSQNGPKQGCFSRILGQM